jgi:Holliday junction resolvasome RuvABC endonuclease subunit
MGAETSRLVPVMNGSACAGFLIDLGARGTEAFDKDEKSLGVFPDVISAATAVKQSAAPDAAGGMRVLGVDPGISGGLAIVEITDGAAPVLVKCIDIPVVGTGAKERVDVTAIRNFIDRHKPICARIERAQAMPRQGASSGFKYGRAVGAIEAAIALCEIPVEIVEPAVWKRAFRLPGKDKEAARQRALELFPAAHAVLARKKDHGRAEATLIALYGAKSS